MVYFNKAVFLELSKDNVGAYNLHKFIIKENPYFIDSYLKLGELCKLEGNNKKALEYFIHANDRCFKVSKENDKRILISEYNKPIIPLLMISQTYLDLGNENEARKAIDRILKGYDGNDSYTLTLLGNFYYEQAIHFRILQKKPEFVHKLKKAFENYYLALQNDKHNMYAVNGMANIMSEYSYTDHSYEIYRSLSEKIDNTICNTNSKYIKMYYSRNNLLENEIPTNFNQHLSLYIELIANEALLCMNNNQFEKASLLLQKINKYNKDYVTLLFSINFCYNKSFDDAIEYMNKLITKDPENVYFRYNYALILRKKSEYYLWESETECKVKQTKEAIKDLEKAIKIFESLLMKKKEIMKSFKNVSK